MSFIGGGSLFGRRPVPLRDRARPPMLAAFWQPDPRLAKGRPNKYATVPAAVPGEAAAPVTGFRAG
jgi:hypothetical protein